MYSNVCAGLFGLGLVCGLRGEGRRDWEVGLWCGIKMSHMITLESIEFRFFGRIFIIHTI